MRELYKAIWLEILFQRDGYSNRKRWLRDCDRSGYLHPALFRQSAAL